MADVSAPQSKRTMLLFIALAALMTVSLDAATAGRVWLQGLGWCGLLLSAFLLGVHSWSLRRRRALST